ncbi:MAG: beta-propeller domain-containing protein [Kofleriaceae bacterium]
MRRPRPVAPSILLGSLALTLAACGDDLPGDHVLARTTTLVQYASCDDLERDLEDQLIAEVELAIDRAHDGGGGGGPPLAGGEDSSGGDGGGRQEGVDYSGTNNQEAGVDEADLVKTDGYHLYALNGNRLHILGVPEFGQLVPESETTIEGYPIEMLLDGDRAVVFSTIYVEALPEDHPLRDLVGFEADDVGWWWRSNALTKVTVLDVADRTAPALVDEVFYEGYYQTAREHDGSIRLAGYAWFDQPALWDWWQVFAATDGDVAATKAFARTRIRQMTLDDFVPQLYVRTPEGAFSSNSLTTASCQSFYRPTDSHARGVTSILSLDLSGGEVAWDADHVISNWGTVYASTDTLVLAEAAHDWWWYWNYVDDPEHLNVHVFDIGTAGQTAYLGSGRVEGYLINQFAIDEEDGDIRLATTTNLWGRWWDETPPEPDNHVWVLAPGAEGYDVVGHLHELAPGEQIMSARFLGDVGYLVTFEQTDPLWTLDLSDPTDPRVVGGLEVPGFSTYLHPLAGDRLLSIGVGGDETGANWQTTVSLFDVADPAAPALVEALPLALEGGWGWSEALWQHKAFQYWAPAGLLAVPQSSYREHVDGDGNYTWDYLSRLEVIEVDPAGDLRRRGAIDHSAYYQADADTWWANVDIRRSIFMGDYLYAISDKAITVHTTADLALVTAQPLPGYQADELYWWW